MKVLVVATAILLALSGSSAQTATQIQQSFIQYATLDVNAVANAISNLRLAATNIQKSFGNQIQNEIARVNGLLAPFGASANAFKANLATYEQTNTAKVSGAFGVINTELNIITNILQASIVVPLQSQLNQLVSVVGNKTNLFSCWTTYAPALQSLFASSLAQVQSYAGAQVVQLNNTLNGIVAAVDRNITSIAGSATSLSSVSFAFL